jgi:hypothetical protein
MERVVMGFMGMGLAVQVRRLVVRLTGGWREM